MKFTTCRSDTCTNAEQHNTIADAGTNTNQLDNSRTNACSNAQQLDNSRSNACAEQLDNRRTNACADAEQLDNAGTNACATRANAVPVAAGAATGLPALPGRLGRAQCDVDRAPPARLLRASLERRCARVRCAAAQSLRCAARRAICAFGQRLRGRVERVCRVAQRYAAACGVVVRRRSHVACDDWRQCCSRRQTEPDNCTIESKLVFVLHTHIATHP
jgi:hypothetical protein